MNTPSDALPSAMALLQDGSEGGAPSQWILIGILLVVFWFVILGPERKQKKLREAMLENMKKGDEVLLSSGMYGTLVTIADDTVKVQVADGVRIKFSRAAVQQVLGKDDPPKDAKAEKGEKAVASAKD